MRLDKFLKVSRLIKRRTVANEACDAGRVLVNDRPAKASAQVKAGDVLEIQFGSKSVRVEVLNVQETVKKKKHRSFTATYKKCGRIHVQRIKKRKPSYNGCIDHCMEVFCMGEMNEQAHRLLLEQRKTLSLGGVQDVKSFDENEVLLVTVCGVLTIRGKELHVGRLELEKGEADIEGSIDSLVYTEHGPLQKKGSALARLFR